MRLHWHLALAIQSVTLTISRSGSRSRKHQIDTAIAHYSREFATVVSFVLVAANVKQDNLFEALSFRKVLICMTHHHVSNRAVG